MKRTISITMNGKTSSNSYNVRDISMLDVYRKNTATIVRNRKKYTRKEKHKTIYV